MMNNPITGYQSLADEDYKMLAYVSSLKGLLKPFKSKGSWSCWRATPKACAR